MEPIPALREKVIEQSNNTVEFRHRKWFAKYHLEIVEKIALELCAHYPKADRQLVQALVWIHDYGKILDFDNQYRTTLTAGAQLMQDLGFSPAFSATVIRYAEILDKKDNLASPATPLEVKIASSADGAAHLVGPFYYLWWHENSHRPFEELMAENRQKLEKDWSKKIVLPEVIRAFSARRDLVLEQSGQIPSCYFDPPQT